MKKLFFLAAVLTFALSGCVKDKEWVDPNENTTVTKAPSDGVALIAYGDVSDGVALRESHQLVDRIVSLQDNTKAEIDAALATISDGGFVYIMVDCSVFGGEMPTRAYEDLSAFWTEWTSGSYYDFGGKTITPVWIVNVVNPEEAGKLFGITLGTGWYVMTDDLALPKFSEEGSLSGIRLQEYVLKIKEAMAAGTRADEKEVAQPPVITRHYSINYFITNPNMNPMTEDRTKMKTSKYFPLGEQYLTKRAPTEDEMEMIKKTGGAMVSLDVALEICYVPGHEVKGIKVTTSNGYQLIPYINDRDVMSYWVHSGDAFVGYMMRNFTVDVTLQSTASNVIALSACYPDVTQKDYKVSEEKGFSISLGMEGEGSYSAEKGGGGKGSVSLGMTWSSTEKISYDMTNMYVQRVSETGATNRSRSTTWKVCPEWWNKKPAFENDDKSRPLAVDVHFAKSSLPAGGGTLFSAIRDNVHVSEMNFQSSTTNKQVATFRVSDPSNGDLTLIVNAGLNVQNSNIGYVAGVRRGCYWKTSIFDTKGIKDLSLKVPITFQDPAVFGSFVLVPGAR